MTIRDTNDSPSDYFGFLLQPERGHEMFVEAGAGTRREVRLLTTEVIPVQGPFGSSATREKRSWGLTPEEAHELGEALIAAADREAKRFDAGTGVEGSGRVEGVG